MPTTKGVLHAFSLIRLRTCSSRHPGFHSAHVRDGTVKNVSLKRSMVPGIGKILTRKYWNRDIGPSIRYIYIQTHTHVLTNSHSYTTWPSCSSSDLRVQTDLRVLPPLSDVWNVRNRSSAQDITKVYTSSRRAAPRQHSSLPAGLSSLRFSSSCGVWHRLRNWLWDLLLDVLSYFESGISTQTCLSPPNVRWISVNSVDTIMKLKNGKQRFAKFKLTTHANSKQKIQEVRCGFTKEEENKICMLLDIMNSVSQTVR